MIHDSKWLQREKGKGLGIPCPFPSINFSEHKPQKRNVQVIILEKILQIVENKTIMKASVFFMNRSG